MVGVTTKPEGISVHDESESTHPSRTLNLTRLYEYRFRGIDQSTRQGLWSDLAPFIHEKMGRPERVVDPAAGRGEFLLGLPGVERWAVDLEAHADLDASTGIRFIRGNALTVGLPVDYFDGVFMSNFLEHLSSHDDIAQLLGNMRDALKPGGRIAIMGPNFKYCATSYFDCADHVLALSHMAVEEHLAAAGFEPKSTIPRFMPYSFRGALPPSRTLARWYLKMPLAWRVLGKQFLVLARKPLHQV